MAINEVSSVPIAGRVPPEVRKMAELAADAEGDSSLSRFVGRAVEKEAFRVIVRRGVSRRPGRDAEDAAD